MTLQILNFGRPVMIQAGLDELDQARLAEFCQAKGAERGLETGGKGR